MLHIRYQIRQNPKGKWLGDLGRFSWDGLTYALICTENLGFEANAVLFFSSDSSSESKWTRSRPRMAQGWFEDRCFPGLFFQRARGTQFIAGGRSIVQPA